MLRPDPTSRHRTAFLAGFGTDDAPDLPAWCAESGCDACRQFDDEPVPGRQPGGRVGSPASGMASPRARLPRHRRHGYP